LELEASEHWVMADPVRLQQICWNLLNNAVKFTPRGGSIVVRSGNDAHGSFALEVEDTGIGIEPAALNHIFDAFQQGQRSITREFGGLGLGLAISKSLADSHGGCLEASSAGKNAGATFKLALKTVTGERGAPAIHPDSLAQKRKLRILAVDDHDDTRRVLANLLRTKGHEVLTAMNVASALDTLSRESIDVLLSDIGLPDGTGYDLMERAKVLQPLIGIALSGFGTAEDISRATESGFAHHLIKPVNFDQLEATLARVTSKKAFEGGAVIENSDALQQAS
jgi:CheY-like chemotaxis protein